VYRSSKIRDVETLPYPRVGVFEVRLGSKVFFSTYEFGLWPNPRQIATKILEYLEQTKDRLPKLYMPYSSKQITAVSTERGLERSVYFHRPNPAKAAVTRNRSLNPYLVNGEPATRAQKEFEGIFIDNRDEFPPQKQAYSHGDLIGDAMYKRRTTVNPKKGERQLLEAIPPAHGTKGIVMAQNLSARLDDAAVRRDANFTKELIDRAVMAPKPDYQLWRDKDVVIPNRLGEDIQARSMAYKVNPTLDDVVRGVPRARKLAPKEGDNAEVGNYQRKYVKPPGKNELMELNGIVDAVFDYMKFLNHRVLNLEEIQEEEAKVKEDNQVLVKEMLEQLTENVLQLQNIFAISGPLAEHQAHSPRFGSELHTVSFGNGLTPPKSQAPLKTGQGYVRKAPLNVKMEPIQEKTLATLEENGAANAPEEKPIFSPHEPQPHERVNFRQGVQPNSIHPKPQRFMGVRPYG
jgi:hypothetical protein